MAEAAMSDVFHSLVRAFKFYDTDKNGRLNFEEFRQALEEATGYDHILKAGRLPGGKDEISLKEFLDIVMEDWPEQSVEQEIQATFEEMDKNGDGFITPDELRDRLKDLQYVVTEAEVATVFAQADANGDGKIEIDEFKKKMLEYVGMTALPK